MARTMRGNGTMRQPESVSGRYTAKEKTREQKTYNPLNTVHCFGPINTVCKFAYCSNRSRKTDARRTKKAVQRVVQEGKAGIVTSVVIMWWIAACHGRLVNGIDARLLSLCSLQRGDTILSCANILHVGTLVHFTNHLFLIDVGSLSFHLWSSSAVTTLCVTTTLSP